MIQALLQAVQPTETTDTDETANPTDATSATGTANPTGGTSATDLTGALYLPDFPAWVHEQAEDRQRVVVHDRDRVVARSRPLARAGLETGTPMDRARELFEHASFHERDPQLEHVFWEDVRTRVYRSTPRLLPLRPGWMLFEPPSGEMLQALADRLDAQVGAAAERPVARLAALEATPGRVMMVEPEETERFLRRVDVRRLGELKFEAECVNRLRLFGLETADQVRTLTERHLEAQFGPQGRRLHRFFHPEEAEERIPLYQPPVSVSETFEFDRPAAEPGELLPVLEHLIRETTGRLGDRACRRVSVRLYRPGKAAPTSMTRLLRKPTTRRQAIWNGARYQLKSLLRSGCSAVRMELELGGLTHVPQAQGSLFFERGSVKKALQFLLRRFPDRLFRPVVDEPNAYLPERVAHLEPVAEEEAE